LAGNREGQVEQAERECMARFMCSEKAGSDGTQEAVAAIWM
jgi:hypothetical protein